MAFTGNFEGQRELAGDQSRTHDLAEQEILERGLDQLRELLGDNWEVAPQVGDDQATHPGDRGFDLIVTIRNKTGRGIQGQIFVEAKRHLTPKSAQQVLARLPSTTQQLGGPSGGLVISPWLSPRTREVLEQHGCGYLDLTGNVSLRLNQAGLLIRTDGAQRDPSGPVTQGRSLRGAAAARLVRLLVDVKPPFRPVELAHYSGLSLPYVSRLLDLMEQQALLTRQKRLIRDVAWPGLLRARAETTALLPPRPASAHWIAGLPRQGVEATLARLPEVEQRYGGVAVTGSYAAAAVAPLAIGGSLITYVRPHANLDVIAKELYLLRTVGPQAAEGAAFLIQASDPVIFWNRRSVEGIPHVALSQLTIDCLSGPGRLPAEGEAVLTYMTEHEDEWRLNDLDEFSGPGIVAGP